MAGAVDDSKGLVLPATGAENDLLSCTKTIGEYKVKHPEKGVVTFVDTPGFNGSKGDPDALIFAKVASWLQEKCVH
jgi:hypothetical protein